ncbi:MAG: LLM class flavin-dependent oxidoreductase [Actinomycetota bacterium]|jgi:5,10-methylenetetrahydromethanopterin reductase|nr:MAG: coenzyme dependent N5,N10-methenyltetrahydromethanopterin reductase [Acidimicrobiaceae bacterium]
MVAVGIHIVPLMPAADVVTVAREAERIGYDYCLVADEGLHVDVYVALGAIATQTERIALGPMTNGYTRHPAATAAALATVNALSGGRALVTMLAGGSMTLGPMGLARRQPFQVVADAVEVLSRLWTGETVTWQGATCSLDNARLGLGRQQIPVWIASRGPRLLTLAGQVADGAMVTVKPDLGAALGIVVDAAAQAERRVPTRTYLGRVCYEPAMLEQQKLTLSFVLMDSPERVLVSLGLTPAEVDQVTAAAAANRPELVDPIVTDDLLRRYQISGTPEDCTAEVAKMVAAHELDVVLIDVLSSNLEENLRLLHESYPILTGVSR